MQVARTTLKQLAVKIKEFAEGMAVDRRLLDATTLDLSSAELVKGMAVDRRLLDATTLDLSSAELVKDTILGTLEVRA
jgi:hypothetical protein